MSGYLDTIYLEYCKLDDIIDGNRVNFNRGTVDLWVYGKLSRKVLSFDNNLCGQLLNEDLT
jgi:hypothetical protein